MSKKNWSATEKFLIKAVEQLESEKPLGISLVEYSRTVVDRPENYEKIANSFAGHAVHLQNKITLRELRLWCVRVLEPNGHSLFNVSRCISNHSKDLVEKWRNEHPDWSKEELELDKLSGRISKFVKDVESLSKDHALTPMKIFRDEELAHLLRGVSDRREKTANSEKLRYSYNDVFRVADLAINLISEAIWIYRFQAHDDDRTRKIVRSYYESYWKLLPKFSDVEDR